MGIRLQAPLLRRTGRAAAMAALGAVVLAGCASAPRRAPPALPSGRVPRSLYPPPPEVLQIPDAVPRIEPRSKRGNPPFYEALGHRYYVLSSAKGYDARGVASWYGPQFDGLRTADGEPYDMYAMTAAHKTLPIPCYVRVTNLGNGRSVVVRVNDRGPFVANRIIDLSYTAAAKLGMLRTGTAFVDVRAITPGSPSGNLLTRADESPPQALFAQVGAFRAARNAWKLYARLKKAGFKHAFVLSLPQQQRLYRVRIGPLASVPEYDALVARLAKAGVEHVYLAPD
ncbi:MAG: septal ring lytic transglycosylase RlpA family protein [Steroidobacteraceae bacterium]